ncbi:MAG: L-lactate permease [Chloroflexi bacterium]|nr:L-lactate permease [Chloroflexota bacterium]
MLEVAAAAPLVVAFVALALLGQSGLRTGLLTFAVAAALALLVPAFRLAPDRLAAAIAEGSITALVVLEVLLPGLLLYHVQRSSGSLDALARTIVRLAAERRLQVLVLVLGVSPFVESASGFGLGAVVITPILLALKLEPATAASLGALSLLAVPWGALAVGTVLGADLTGLDSSIVGAQTAVLTAPLPVFYGMAALGIAGGWPAVRHGWPAALAASATLSAGLWAFSLLVGVELAGVLASLLSLGLLLGWEQLAARVRGAAPLRMPPTPMPLTPMPLTPMPPSPMPPTPMPPTPMPLTPMPPTPMPLTPMPPTPMPLTPMPPTPMPLTPMSPTQIPPLPLDTPPTDRTALLQALAPYVILTVLLLFSRLIMPLRGWLQSHLVLAVPGLEPSVAILYNPGFWVLLAVLVAAVVSQVSPKELRATASHTWRQFLPGAIAIVGFLAAAQIMRASGMTETLGAAAAGLGSGYVWAAPWLGALGGWLTGSNAGSNAMFARLHLETALRAGLDPTWVLAAQNAAASHATMVSPARAILAAMAAGSIGGEGVILRRIGPLVMVAILLVTLLLAAIDGRTT